MHDLAIYGAGGFGRETALMIEQINKVKDCWRVVGFYDDGLEKGSKVDGLTILGGLADLKVRMVPATLVLAIADPVVRKRIVDQLNDLPIDFPSLVHPLAILGSASNIFGRGSIITAGCIFTTGVVVGEFSIINLATTLGHDVKVDRFCTLMPACNISGSVRIGECTLIGTGAQILQNLNVGRNCKVGAGAVVTKDFGDGLTLVGVPARAIG